jgi:hypothetical protein
MPWSASPYMYSVTGMGMLYLVGARYSVTSRDLRILMDQPTKSISPRDRLSRHDNS